MEKQCSLNLKNSYLHLFEYIADVTQQVYKQNMVLAHIQRFSEQNYRFTNPSIIANRKRYVEDNVNYMLDLYNELHENYRIQYDELHFIDDLQGDYRKQLRKVKPEIDKLFIKQSHRKTMEKILGDLNIKYRYNTMFNPKSPDINLIP